MLGKAISIKLTGKENIFIHDKNDVFFNNHFSFYILTIVVGACYCLMDMLISNL